MTEEQAFLDAIETDSQVRLIYADWLQERGRDDDAFWQRAAVAVRPVLEDPKADEPRLEFADWLDTLGRNKWAEYIRLAIRLDNKPLCPDWCDHTPERCDRTRISQILVHSLVPELIYWPGRVGKWHQFGKPGQVRNTSYINRGFIETVVCSGELWLANAPTMLLYHPVNDVVLYERPTVYRYSEGTYRLVGGTRKWPERLVNYPYQAPPAGLDSFFVLRVLLRAEWPNIEFHPA